MCHYHVSHVMCHVSYIKDRVLCRCVVEFHFPRNVGPIRRASRRRVRAHTGVKLSTFHKTSPRLDLFLWRFGAFSGDLPARRNGANENKSRKAHQNPAGKQSRHVTPPPRPPTPPTKKILIRILTLPDFLRAGVCVCAARYFPVRRRPDNPPATILPIYHQSTRTCPTNIHGLGSGPAVVTPSPC